MKSMVKVGMLGILSVLAFSPLLTGCPGKNNPTAPAATNTPVPATATPVISNTSTATPSSTPSGTATNSPTKTPTTTPSRTATQTPTDTPLATATHTSTATPSSTPSSTPTVTPTSSPTDSPTITPTDTASSTATNSPTDTPSSTPTVTSTPTHYYSAFVTFGGGFMSQPFGMSFNGSGQLWIVNYAGNILQKWATIGGSPVTNITSFNGGDLFSGPIGCGVNPVSGDVYVGDRTHNRYVVFNSAGTYQTTFTDGVCAFTGAAFNSSGTTLYALDQNGKCLAVPVTAGSPPTFGNPVTFANSGPGAISSSFSVHTDSHDNIWIADYSSLRVWEYNPSLVYQRAITVTGLPYDFGIDGSDNVFVSDGSNDDIVEFDSSGQQVTTFGTGSGLSIPFGVAVDTTGHYVYVTDYASNQVIGYQRFN